MSSSGTREAAGWRGRRRGTVCAGRGGGRRVRHALRPKTGTGRSESAPAGCKTPGSRVVRVVQRRRPGEVGGADDEDGRSHRGGASEGGAAERPPVPPSPGAAI